MRLTTAQRRVLVALCTELQAAPSTTVASVARRCGLAASTTHTHLKRMQAMGLVAGSTHHRSLRPADGVVLTSRGPVQVVRLEEAS